MRKFPRKCNAKVGSSFKMPVRPGEEEKIELRQRMKFLTLEINIAVPIRSLFFYSSQNEL